MKKKWLALLLAVVMLMVVAVITSCSCSDEREDPPGPTSSSQEGPGTTDNSGNQPDNPDNPDKPDDPDNPDNPQVSDNLIKPVIQYVRIAEIGAETVTVKFNATGKNLSYEIRYSSSPITEENFKDATLVSGVNVTGSGEVKTAVLNLKADKNNKNYIAVQAKSGQAYSTIETVRAGGLDLVYVDPKRITSVYCGEVIKNLTPLFDEFEGIIDPMNGEAGRLPTNRLAQFYHKKGDWLPGMLDPFTDTHERYGTDLAPIIDLEYEHYIEAIMVFYSHEAYDLDVRSSKDFANFNTPEDWDGTNESYPASSFQANSWNLIPIGKTVRFIQLQFLDGEAPVEVIFYGYQTGETKGDELGETTHKLPTVGELMGVCGLLGWGSVCGIEDLKCATVLREYHNFGWSYNASSFPKKATSLESTNVGNFDSFYEKHHQYNLIVPCLQWSDGDNPAKTYNTLTGKLNSEVASFTEKYLPSTYIAYADNVYQFAARYGSSKMGYLYDNVRTHSDGGDKIGLNYIKWIELGNEPNGEDQRGTTPYQLAALTSCAYDGHMRTVLADVYNPDDYTYFLGGKNADPDIKLAMAGLAGIGDAYITSMCYWMRANREDIHGTWTSKNDAIAMDAFNVHTYFGELYTLNGQQVYVGVSPEEYGLVDAMSNLIEFRDKYYPGVEIWLTEFGWDTNESYETMTSSHSYGEYTSREVQGMWLTRAYLLLSSCGVDKATMYMLADFSGANDRTAIGKYGTCGVIAYAFTDDNEQIYLDEGGNECIKKKYTDKDGNEKEGYFYLDNGQPVAKNPQSVKLEYKPGYYYMRTLLNALYDYTFRRELKSGNDDVWVYQYSNPDHDEAYAVWCPTSNMTKVDGYKLYVGTDYENVTLIESDADNKLVEGKKTELTVDAQGYVSINVSENPVYVIVNK